MSLNDELFENRLIQTTLGLSIGRGSENRVQKEVQSKVSSRKIISRAKAELTHFQKIDLFSLYWGLVSNEGPKSRSKGGQSKASSQKIISEPKVK